MGIAIANQNHVFVVKPHKFPLNISVSLFRYKLMAKIMIINEMKCHIWYLNIFLVSLMFQIYCLFEIVGIM